MCQRAFMCPCALLVLAATGLGASPPPPSNPETAPSTVPASAAARPEASRAQLMQNYRRIPLSFEQNQGQTDPQVQYLARGAGYALFLTPDAAVMRLRAADPRSHRLGTRAKNQIKEQKVAVVRAQLVGARKSAAVHGEELLPGRSNYFIGRDSKQWHTGVPHYGRVRYSGVYPGVDLVYYGSNQQQLEYDFVVAPGSDPRVIRLAYRGGRHLRIDRQGDLHIATSGGELVQHKPVVYQVLDGQRQPVEGRFKLVRGNAEVTEVAFALAAYDHSRALTIDPVLTLVYSTYLGGSADNDDGPAADQANGIAVDGSGNIYVAGSATSIDFPVTAGAFQTVSGSVFPAIDLNDAFITKINPGSTSLIYSTYLGGTGYDYANAIAVDSSGNAYVAGSTTSDTTFPITAGTAYQPSFGSKISPGFGDVIFAELNSTGSTLLYSTFLGGEGDDSANAIAVDSSRNVYIAGNTISINFPTSAGAFQKVNKAGMGLHNAFVTKLNPAVAGSAGLVYSSYLGGEIYDVAYAVTVDGSGDAYVAGATQSTMFPTYLPLQATLNGTQNAFITEFNPAGSALLYSTYLGGGGTDGASAIAIDGSGDAYVAGSTTSSNFPITSKAFQNTLGSSNGNAFVSKLGPGGSTLAYSTYLGGNGGASGDYANAIAVDSSDNVYVAGSAASSNFPVTPDAFQPALGGTLPNAFITELNPASSNLLYSTYLGGSGGEGPAGDGANAVALDASGNLYVAGFAFSSNFPTVKPYQAALGVNAMGGVENAFIAEFSPPPPPPPPVPSVSLSANPSVVALGQSTTLSWSSANVSTCTASGAWSGPEATGGSQLVTPTAAVGGSNSYVLSCSGTYGTALGEVTVIVSPPPTVTISVSPATIGLSNPATLSWSSTNATSCTASGAWSGSVGTNGTSTVQPTAAGNDTYTLTCAGPGGTASGSALLQVNAPPVLPAPTVSISASPSSLSQGQSTLLSWSSTNASSCSASGAWSGPEAIGGTQTVIVNAVGANTYTLICSGSGGSASGVVTVTATAPPPPAPVVSISASPLVVGPGQSSTLSWTSTNAQSCTASGAWSGTQPSSGSLSVTPTASGNNSYVLTCSNASGQGFCLAGVIVAAQAVGGGSGGGSGGSFGPWSLLPLGILSLTRRRGRSKHRQGSACAE